MILSPSLRRTTGALALFLTLTSCGGAGNGSNTFAPPSGIASRATVAIQLTIPSATVQVHARSPRYISPFTQGLGITLTPSGSATPIPDTTPTVAIDLSNQSTSSPPSYGSLGPNGQSMSCTLSTVTANARLCTITLSIVPGTYNASIVAWDQPPVTSAPSSSTAPSFAATAHELSTLTQPISVTAGSSTALNLVLDGVVSTLSIAALPLQPHLVQVGSNLTAIGSGPLLLEVAALDADGNEIVGDGAPTISLTDSAHAFASIAPPSTYTGGSSSGDVGGGIWTLHTIAYAPNGTTLTASALSPNGSTTTTSLAVTTEEELWAVIGGGSPPVGSTGREPQYFGPVAAAILQGFAVPPGLSLTPTVIPSDFLGLGSLPTLCGQSGPYSSAAANGIAENPASGELWLAFLASTSTTGPNACVQALALNPYEAPPAIDAAHVINLYSGTPTGAILGPIAFQGSATLWGVDTTTANILAYNLSGTGPFSTAASITPGTPNTGAGTSAAPTYYTLALSPSTAANYPNSLYVSDTQSAGGSSPIFQVERYPISGSSLGTGVLAQVGSTPLQSPWAVLAAVAADANGNIYTVNPAATVAAGALLGLTPNATGYTSLDAASFAGPMTYANDLVVAPDGSLWALSSPTASSSSISAYAVGTNTLTPATFTPLPSSSLPIITFTIAP